MFTTDYCPFKDTQAALLVKNSFPRKRAPRKAMDLVFSRPPESIPSPRALGDGDHQVCIRLLRSA